ncbi:MAG: B12-binding domain-containing radical SAM protein [Desulfomonilia bacterium]
MKARRVLLINPWIYDFAAYDLWAKPLGLLSIGAVLRANGCEVDFIDCLRSSHPLMNRKRPKSREGGHGKFFRELITKPPVLSDIPRGYARYGVSPDVFRADLEKVPSPDVILVTSLMTYWYPGVVDTITTLKDVFPDVPVILGGIYATLCTEHAEMHSGADHVLSHEGEVRIIEFLSRLWGTHAIYRPDLRDLDTLPYPCFDLIEDLRYVCIQTSRGCPFRCTYCASQYLSGFFRRRDPNKVIQEILHWNRAYRVQDFAFYDDALLVQPEAFAVPMLEGLISREMDIRFHCPNGLHIRHLSKQLAALMRKAGFVTIRLGFETADRDRQRMSGSKVTTDEFLRAVDALHCAGYDSSEIGVYILCGLPFQEAQDVMNTIEVVKKAGARPMLAEYSPIPHTDDWDRAVAGSRYPLGDDPLFQNNTLLPCGVTSLTHEQYQDIKWSLR